MLVELTDLVEVVVTGIRRAPRMGLKAAELTGRSVLYDYKHTSDSELGHGVLIGRNEHSSINCVAFQVQFLGRAQW